MSPVVAKGPVCSICSLKPSKALWLEGQVLGFVLFLDNTWLGLMELLDASKQKKKFFQKVKAI